MQLLHTVAPGVAENVAAAHGVQNVALAPLYVPTGHRIAADMPGRGQ